MGYLSVQTFETSMQQYCVNMYCCNVSDGQLKCLKGVNGYNQHLIRFALSRRAIKQGNGFTGSSVATFSWMISLLTMVLEFWTV